MLMLLRNVITIGDSKGVTLPKQLVKNKKQVYIVILEAWEVDKKLKGILENG